MVIRNSSCIHANPAFINTYPEFSLKREISIQPQAYIQNLNTTKSSVFVQKTTSLEHEIKSKTEQNKKIHQSVGGNP